MIIDVHSHAWPFPDAFSEDFIRQASGAKANATIDISVRYEDYAATAPSGTRTIVFGGKAKLAGVWVDDAYVADYVGKHPDALIGFLSVDLGGGTAPRARNPRAAGGEAAADVRGIFGR